MVECWGWLVQFRAQLGEGFQFTETRTLSVSTAVILSMAGIWLRLLLTVRGRRRRQWRRMLEQVGAALNLLLGDRDHWSNVG